MRADERDSWGYEECDWCHGGYHHTQLKDGRCRFCKAGALGAPV